MTRSSIRRKLSSSRSSSLMSSRTSRGARSSPTFGDPSLRTGLSLKFTVLRPLWLARRAGRQLLQRPAAAVWIAEEDEGAPGVRLDVAYVDTPSGQLCVRSLDVRDDDLWTSRADGSVRESLAEGDGARRPGWRQLHEADLLAHGVVVVDDATPGAVLAPRRARPACALAAGAFEGCRAHDPRSGGPLDAAQRAVVEIRDPDHALGYGDAVGSSAGLDRGPHRTTSPRVDAAHSVAVVVRDPMRPSATARPAGPAPAAIGCPTSRPVCGSRRLTVP